MVVSGVILLLAFIAFVVISVFLWTHKPNIKAFGLVVLGKAGDPLNPAHYKVGMIVDANGKINFQSARR